MALSLTRWLMRCLAEKCVSAVAATKRKETVSVDSTQQTNKQKTSRFYNEMKFEFGDFLRHRWKKSLSTAVWGRSLQSCDPKWLLWHSEKWEKISNLQWICLRRSATTYRNPISLQVHRCDQLLCILRQVLRRCLFSSEGNKKLVTRRNFFPNIFAWGLRSAFDRLNRLISCRGLWRKFQVLLI